MGLVGTFIITAEGSVQEHPALPRRHSSELTPQHEGLMELHICNVVLCNVCAYTPSGMEHEQQHEVLSQSRMHP